MSRATTSADTASAWATSKRIAVTAISGGIVAATRTRTRAGQGSRCQARRFAAPEPSSSTSSSATVKRAMRRSAMKATGRPSRKKRAEVITLVIGATARRAQCRLSLNRGAGDLSPGSQRLVHRVVRQVELVANQAAVSVEAVDLARRPAGRLVVVERVVAQGQQVVVADLHEGKRRHDEAPGRQLVMQLKRLGALLWLRRLALVQGERLPGA